MPALEDVVALLHGWYPPASADGWDAVGLVYGDPAAPVGKVQFAVDPTPEVAREAADWGADLLVVHHPLFLKPVHGFAATTPKGRTLATLATAGCALLTAHTNADRAVGGVSEALATALGLTDLAPVAPSDDGPLDKLTVYVPVPDADAVRAAIAGAGAGSAAAEPHAPGLAVGLDFDVRDAFGGHADDATALVGEPQHAVVGGQRLLDRLLDLVDRRVELERQLLRRVDDPNPYFHIGQPTAWAGAFRRPGVQAFSRPDARRWNGRRSRLRRRGG